MAEMRRLIQGKTITGRHLKKTTESTPPAFLSAAEGDKKGEIHLIWDSCINANSYLLQKCSSLKKPLKWKHEDIINSNYYTVTNLKSNKNYLFRIAVITRFGKSKWSPPVKKKAP
ncbi:MAG: hypothetical protein UZ05_CHB002002351 [Chlorobi bacterium OLB5]|nr:MAG: hypothetical protein UZ05_CHB002002351 [Chlorobi bacterium OLB5]